MRRITVSQGQVRVSDDTDVELSTVLGSCIATCLFDPVARVGGMNHFLLAEPPAGHARDEVDHHYGVYLMELLINEMLGQGALKHRLQAHLFGGADMLAGKPPLGPVNAAFAREFLEHDGIALHSQDLGGNHARQIDFCPATGALRFAFVEDALAPEFKPAPRTDRMSGEVEFF